MSDETIKDNAEDQEQQPEIKPNLMANPIVRLFIVGLLVGIVLMGTFYVGAKFACYGGYADGLKCVAPKVVGACEFVNGDLILVDENISQQSNKIGLYKELDINGSLSNQTYIQNNGSFIEVNDGNLKLIPK